MALTQGKLCDWSDIETLFNNLNVERQRFGYGTLTVPSNEGTKFVPSTVQSLVTGISDLRNNSFVGTTANVSEITVPTQGNLIKPLPLTQIQTRITNISNVRICSNFAGGNFGDFSDFDGGNFGDFTTDFDGGNFGDFSRRSNFTSFNGGGSCRNFTSFNGGGRAPVSFNNFNSGHYGSNDSDYNSNDDFVSSIFG